MAVDKSQYVMGVQSNVTRALAAFVIAAILLTGFYLNWRLGKKLSNTGYLHGFVFVETYLIALLALIGSAFIFSLKYIDDRIVALLW